MSENVFVSMPGMAVCVALPRPPNFFRLGLIHQHPEEMATLPITAFTEEALRLIGAAWTDALIAHSRKRPGAP